MKPEIYDDEILADLEMRTGLPLFRIFTGLWCFSDREGRFEWAPRSLRGKIHPCWDGDMAAALEALASKLYIVRYTVDGKDYGYVRTFAEHQAIHPREPRSTLPAPADHGRTLSGKRLDESVDESGSLEIEIETEVEVETETEAPGLAAAGATLLHRKGKPSRKRPAVGIPDDLKPNDTARYLATQLGVDIDAEMPAFRDHHLKLDSRFSDWQAAIRTWVRNAHKFAPKSGQRQRRSEADDRLQAQTERVRMLREQEAEEERRAAGGGT